ncbi:zinc finger and SCAN domain-containing protein 21-like [Anopheles nili]|uniref:zinc finger and SCAN domain-containing protein 21-like n=1 Tax=Anopheles nili TaxID=185578 RepID=UPI00237B0FD9|nr:zinc finger and SCAN domain-containing protein 21-like [Anopheles nili]
MQINCIKLFFTGHSYLELRIFFIGPHTKQDCHNNVIINSIMSRSRCVACHTEERGMIAIYQHPRGVDRLWSYVTGIIVKSKDQLCIACYDELRVAHRFKEKCIHNNLNRLGLGLTKRLPPHAPQEPAVNDDSISVLTETAVPSRLGNSSHASSEECQQVQPRNEPGRTDFSIKSEPPQQEDNNEVTEQQQEDCGSSQNDSKCEADQIRARTSSLEVVKMELELSLDDIGIQPESVLSDSTIKKTDDEHENKSFENMALPSGALKQHQQIEHKKVRRENTNAVKYRRVLTGKINALMCRYCYREFDEPGTKASHEETHLNDPKPFQCSYGDCNRLFQHRSALNRHFYTHVTPKRFKCSVCPKRFHQQSSMVVHERLHRGDKPHICPQCGKGFTHVSNVKRHIRFHNGEKPYQCGKCPARFTTSTDLRRHMNSRRCMMMWSMKMAK